MAVKEVWVNYGVTKNMGNYESLRLDYGVKVTVSEDEDPEQKLGNVRERLRTLIQNAAHAEMTFLHGETKPKIRR